MGKISFSVLVDEMTGAIGNAVVQRGKAGSIVRKRAIPANPQSSAQIEVRGRVTAQSKAWAGLSESQRNAWDVAAASAAWTQKDSLGRNFQLSGEQLYLKLNLEILSVDETVITAPPTKAVFAAIVLGTVTATAGTQALTIAYSGTLGGDEVLKVRASGQGSAGIMSSKSASFVDVTFSAAASPINALSAYTARFGALVAGKKFWVELVQVNVVTGETFTVGRVSKIVAA